jgi:hypothetical protein
VPDPSTIADLVTSGYGLLAHCTKCDRYSDLDVLALSLRFCARGSRVPNAAIVARSCKSIPTGGNCRRRGIDGLARTPDQIAHDSLCLAQNLRARAPPQRLL